MKAIRIHAYGRADQMRLEELPRPAIRPHEALVRIRAAAVNPVDRKIRQGRLRGGPFPIVLGQDFAGEVEEVGPELRGVRPGERVFGFAPGAYAEYAALPARDYARMPSTSDFRAAASIPTAGLTAYQILFDVLRIAKDIRILIHGAGGGVGSFATQLARLKRARVFATASIADASYLMGLGAERVIDYPTERFETKLKDLDAVVDLVGGETLTRSYGIVRRGGTLVSTVEEPDRDELEKRGIRGVGFMLRRDPAQLSRLASLVDQGLVRPKIGRVLPLAEASRAHELDESGKADGKIILEA